MAMISAMTTILASMPQEHERATGGWQTEWIVLPQLFLLASGAIERTAEIAEGLEVDTDRMRKNLDISHGLIMAEAIQMALAEKVGRLSAHDLMEIATNRAAKEKRDLFSIILKTPEIVKTLPEKQLKTLFNPIAYLGNTEEFIERALKEARQSLERPFWKKRKS